MLQEIPPEYIAAIIVSTIMGIGGFLVKGKSKPEAKAPPPAPSPTQSTVVLDPTSSEAMQRIARASEKIADNMGQITQHMPALLEILRKG